MLGAVVGVLALTAGAALGGYFLRDMQGDQEPAPVADDPRTAATLSKSLAKDGFECGRAFSEPVTVNLCFRDSAEHREVVGMQLLGEDRIGWLKVRVESRDAEKSPMKERALSLFGDVLDRALPAEDATPAKEWLAGNLPTDYDKSEYLSHEVGGARLQLLPRKNESALLWIRLTAAAYQGAGERSLPKISAEDLEKHHTDDGYTCRPAERGVTCRKDVDAGESVLAYGVDGDKVTALRRSTIPSGNLESAAPAAKDSAIALVSLMLTGKEIDAAKQWLERSFDGEPHTIVVSGLEIRVNPVSLPAEGRSQYDVDMGPASW